MRLESTLRQSLRLLKSSSSSRLGQRLACAGLGVLMMMSGSTLTAANATWIGPVGTQAWSDGANWNPATGPAATPPGSTLSTVSQDIATFNTSTTGTLLTIDTGRNIRSIVFATGASGSYTIGSAGVNQGEALRLSSGGTIVVNAGVAVPVTINAPMIIEAPSGGGNASYTFENNSTTTTNPNKMIINGSISGGVGSGAATLNLRGTTGNRSDEINTANVVNGLISNGGATSLSVSIVGVSGGASGVWQLTNNNNSYTGATSVSNGTLVFSSIANAGVNSSIGAGDTLVIGTHVKYIGGTATTNRTISGSGSFYNNGSGILTLTGSIAGGLTWRGSGTFDITSLLTGGSGFSRTDPGTVIFSNNANSFTGNLSISDGAFRGATLFNSGVDSAFGRGTTISFGQGSNTVGRLEYTGLTTSTNRTFVLSNLASGTEPITGRGVIDVTTAGQTLTLTGNIHTNNNTATNIAQITLRGAGNGEAQGQIGGTVATPGTGSSIRLLKDGAGTWTLTGSNNYTRDTVVMNGVLNIRHSNALGAVISNEAVPTAAGAGTTVNNGATLQIQGGISVGAEMLTLNGSGFAGQTGALVNVSGTNNFAGDVILAANATISSDSGRLNLTSATAINGSVASRTLTLAGAGTGSISAGLGANISTLTKNGTGTWTLAGTSVHTGATTVNAGTLNLTGSVTGTALTTVANGGTLAGTGSLAGALTVANGGSLSAGNAEIAGSTGTLTIGGNLVLNNTAQLNFDLGTVSDLIVANGALITLDGVLNITRGAGFGTGTYKLIDYTGTLTNNTLTVGMAGFDMSVSVDDTNKDVNLNVTALAGQFWDGGSTTNDGIVNGGDGVWTNAGTNWTNADGTANTSWTTAPVKAAFFDGLVGGTVIVQDAVTISAMHFGKNYTLAAGGGSLQTTTAATEIRVLSGVTTTIAAPITGTGGINKTGEGVLVFTSAAGSNTYAGTTQVTEGTLRLGTTNTLPTNGALLLGANTTTVSLLTPVVTLDLSTASQQVSSLQVATNLTQNNIVTIGSGQTLTVNGAFRVGIATSAKVNTRVVFNGGGALVVNNATANFESGIASHNAALPGGDPTFDNPANSNNSITDLFALSSFTANVNEFRVAQGLLNGSSLTLSNTANNITANTVNVSNTGGNNGGNGLIVLGAGTNVIATNTLNIGLGKGNGTVRFASQVPGSAGTLVLGGKTNSTVNINVAFSDGVNTAASPTGFLELTGHVATVTANDLVIGKRNIAGGGGTDGRVYFSAGTFTANRVEIGTMGGGATGNALGVLRITGGTFTVNTGGSITLGTHTNATAVGTARGTLEINGGTFISNADILSAGALASGATVSGIVNVAGGTLDMTQHDIGSSAVPITLNLTAGTLKDVKQINGGADIEKTGDGTLVIQGDNGYDGNTNISNGTVLISNTALPAHTGSATGNGDILVGSSGTLGGNGRIAGNLTLDYGATLTPGGNATSIASSAPAPGLGTDTGTLVIAGNISVASGANLAFDLKTQGDHGLNATFNPTTGRLMSVSGSSLDGGNDRLIVLGDGAGNTFDLTATITVTFGAGYTGGYQDTFDLIDWSGITLPTSYYDNDGLADGRRQGGVFGNSGSNLILPDLSLYHPDWIWDVSLFASHGVIAIIPEPSKAAFAFLGLLGLLMRRRRGGLR